MRVCVEVDAGDFLTSRWCRVCDEFRTTVDWEDAIDLHGVQLGEFKDDDPEAWEAVRREVEKA